MSVGSSSSVLSTTVANDAVEELRRLQELLSRGGAALSHQKVPFLGETQRPSRSGTISTGRHKLLPYESLTPTRTSKLSATVTAKPKHHDVNVSLKSHSSSRRSQSSFAHTSSQLSRTRTSNNSDANILRTKIEQTLRSSREMQSLLVRQHELLEEASRQIVALSIRDKHRFY